MWLNSFSEDKFDRICAWLAAPDPSINLAKARKEHLQGTGRWILEHSKFRDWITGAVTPSLWLHGKPGCGKTVLCSTIVDHVSDLYRDQPGTILVYFFFRFDDDEKRNSNSMIRSIITQLQQAAPQVHEPLCGLYSSCANGTRSPSPDQLRNTLRELIKPIPRVYIIVDALDECNDREELLEFIDQLFGWRLDNLHILLTSRREEEMKNMLTTWIDGSMTVSLQENVVDADIRAYLTHRLNNDKKLQKWSKIDDLRHEIETTLMFKANGM
jgi:Cdc6-like AAA superfamily ATPase